MYPNATVNEAAGLVAVVLKQRERLWQASITCRKAAAHLRLATKAVKPGALPHINAIGSLGRCECCVCLFYPSYADDELKRVSLSALFRLTDIQHKHM